MPSFFFSLSCFFPLIFFFLFFFSSSSFFLYFLFSPFLFSKGTIPLSVRADAHVYQKQIWDFSIVYAYTYDCRDKLHVFIMRKMWIASFMFSHRERSHGFSNRFNTGYWMAWYRSMMHAIDGADWKNNH